MGQEVFCMIATARAEGEIRPLWLIRAIVPGPKLEVLMLKTLYEIIQVELFPER